MIIIAFETINSILIPDYYCSDGDNDDNYTTIIILHVMIIIAFDTILIATQMVTTMTIPGSESQFTFKGLMHRCTSPTLVSPLVEEYLSHRKRVEGVCLAD